MTPRVTSYLALPRIHGDAALIAVFSDGRLAINEVATAYVWRELPSPDYATLFPHTAPPEGVADQPEKVGKAHCDIRGCDLWICRCTDGDDLRDQMTPRCTKCLTLRPPRPAGEGAR